MSHLNKKEFNATGNNTNENVMNCVMSQEYIYIYIHIYSIKEYI